jgi:glycosyltransferase involved in cell wall biosynthesis
VKVLIVSGIWPPDVGGPASHAPDVADFLRSHGHEVEVVTTADAPPPARAYPVRAVPRHHRRGVRHYRGAALVHHRAREADVVYTTGMFGRSALGATLARKPYVVKLTADPAFERSRRRGLVDGDVDEFQREAGGPAVVLLRFARDVELRHAAHVFTPSAYLRDLAVAWGVPPDKVSVLPNPTPSIAPLPDRDELRLGFGMNGATLAFAGRLTAQKSLGRALEAVADAAGVELLIAGEGPDREPLQRRATGLGIGDRVRFLGAQPRERIVEMFRAADATILSSSWENFPHTVVEALAVGTPVLAMEAGGVAEVVHDGVNGLLVAPGDTAALGAAVRRYFQDDDLRAQLRAAAAGSVSEYAPERVFGELESTLLRVGGSVGGS